MVDKADLTQAPKLKLGRIYSAAELGILFSFSPRYFRTNGGMIPARKKNSLLLITHAGQNSSFEYGNYWNGGDLMYAGRGKKGDQRLNSYNRQVADNSRLLYLFESCGVDQRRFLGRVICVNHDWVTSFDNDREQRKSLLFRLKLEIQETAQPAEVSSAEKPHDQGKRRLVTRLPRSFNSQNAPLSYYRSTSPISPEELKRIEENSSSKHHALLVALHYWLTSEHWFDIEEIFAAVDLWASRGSVKVIFEAKTISEENELEQTRSGLAQLFEYRYLYGKKTDHICLITDNRLSPGRIRMLEHFQVLVLWHDGSTIIPCGPLSQAYFKK